MCKNFFDSALLEFYFSSVRKSSTIVVYLVCSRWVIAV